MLLGLIPLTFDVNTPAYPVHRSKDDLGPLSSTQLHFPRSPDGRVGSESTLRLRPDFDHYYLVFRFELDDLGTIVLDQLLHVCRPPVVRSVTRGDVRELSIEHIDQGRLDFKRLPLRHAVSVDDMGRFEIDAFDLPDPVRTRNLLILEIRAVGSKYGVRKDAVALALADVEGGTVPRVDQAIDIVF